MYNQIMTETAMTKGAAHSMGKKTERISSMNNRWVRLAGQLKTRKYREKNRQFLMEGVRSAEDAFRQGYRDAVCFVTEEAAEEARVQALMEAASGAGWLFLLVSGAMMKALAGTEHSQGVLAILPMPRPDLSALCRPLHGHYVLLDGVQDPGNLGTILRTAAAAGCRGVLLTEGCTDPYGEKAVRSSMGSILRMPVYAGLTLDDVRAVRAAGGLPLIGTALEGGAPYRTAGSLPDAIFVFGNEGSGIRPELLALCDWKLYIPMAGGVESLNVAASAAILLFHFREDE